MPESHRPLIVLCTCPDAPTAGRLARTLVEERLAACVNRAEQVRSTYRWDGVVEEAVETLLLIKTTEDVYQRLENRITEIHPYELPEVIAVGVCSGSPGYIRWIAQNTG